MILTERDFSGCYYGRKRFSRSVYKRDDAAYFLDPRENVAYQLELARP
jgi:hypothetical protein